MKPPTKRASSKTNAARMPLNTQLKLVVLDNLDSFTYNLVHRLAPMVAKIQVVRNDDEEAMSAIAQADGLILSPGPGLPKDAGILMEVIGANWGRLPILGVCLGMQALAEYTGLPLVHAGPPQHGVSREVIKVAPHSMLFQGLTIPATVGLYHSWAVDSFTVGAAATAWLANGVVMAAEWPDSLAHGVQFHPESILTPEGDRLLANWVRFCQNHTAV
jgi:anthranilate synthase component II